MYISITKTTHPGTLLPSDQLGFGIHYTDHMFIMDYSDEKGWYDPRIVPFQNISLSPAACVFHYGAEVFEGLKAYRRPDGEVQLFRPWDNMERHCGTETFAKLQALKTDFCDTVTIDKFDY